MKELDEMEKINAKLSAAVEEVTLEHCKKNEVILTNSDLFPCFSSIIHLDYYTLIYLFVWKDH